MNALDRKIAAALKVLAKPRASVEAQQKSRKTLADARTCIPDAALRQALESCTQALTSFADETKRLPDSDCLRLLQTLNAHALPSASEVLFTSFIVSLKNLKIDMLLSVAPTAKSMVVFLKASGLRKKSFEEKILANPESAYATAALDWFLEKGDARRCAPFLGRLLARLPRPKHLPQWENVVTEAFQSRRGCQLLKALLGAESCGLKQLETLATLLLNNTILLKRITDLLPELLESGVSQQAFQLLGLLLENILVASPQQRPFLSAVIARLGSNLLFKETPSAEQQAALKTIEEAATRLKLATKDPELQAQTWILQRLRTAPERLDGNQHLTMTGARHMAVALEKARQGLSTIGVLAATAKNLGMVTFGAKGERVAYNPLHHEDTQGGLVPGETVEIMEPGWKFRDAIVMRAPVFRSTSTQTARIP